jgi:hypothetical protein
MSAPTPHNHLPLFWCATPHNSRVSARLSRAEAKSDAKPAGSSGGLSPGAIAGIVIGVVLVVVVAVAVVAYFKYVKHSEFDGKDGGIKI